MQVKDVKNKYWVSYSITVIIEYKGVEQEDGFVCATSFSDAVAQLEQYYGVELYHINDLSMYGPVDAPLILSEKVCNEIKEHIV